MKRRSLLAGGFGIIAAPAVARLARAQDRIRPVEFITGSPTASWFPVAAAIAELTNRFYQGQPVSVIPGAGAVSNPVRVGRTQSDLGISYAPFLQLAIQGNNELYREAMPNLRAVASGSTNMLHFVVERGSPIRRVRDLAEQRPRLRIGTGPNGSTELFSLQQLFVAMNLNLRDAETWGGRVERLPTSGRADGYLNRQLDLTNYFINPPAAEIVEMLNSRAGTILNIDDDIRDFLAQRWSFIRYDIAANTYPGQTEPVKTVGLPYVIITHAGADETLIYRIAKVMFENKARLAAAHASFAEWDPRRMHQGLGIDLHPGAARFYREVGLTT
jgi:hypothetical protein